MPLIALYNKNRISNYSVVIHFSSENHRQNLRALTSDDPNDKLLFNIRLTPTYSTEVANYQSAINDLYITPIDYLSNLYPISVRYIKDKQYYVERPPFRANATYKVTSIRDPLTFSFWMPWTIFSLSENYQDNTYAFSSASPLTSLDDSYFPLLTPNIWSDGKICYSNSLNGYYQMNPKMSIRDNFSTKINEYFAGGWNGDITSLMAHLYFDTSHKILAKSDDYSILYDYLYPTTDQVNQLVNSYSSKKIKNILLQIFYREIEYLGVKRHPVFNANIHRDSHHIYSLAFLSKLTLSETLQLHSEIIHYLSNHKPNFLKSFSSIVNKDSSNSSLHFPYATTAVPSYTSVNRSYFDHSNKNLDAIYNIHLVVDKSLYTDHFFPNDIDAMNNSNLSSSNTVFTTYSIINLFFNHKNFHKILTDILQGSFSGNFSELAYLTSQDNSLQLYKLQIDDEVHRNNYYYNEFLSNFFTSENSKYYKNNILNLQMELSNG